MSMTTEEKVVALMALHNEEHIKDDMVYEVWEDGEVTLTKGGDLYGQRTLHCTMLGDPSKALPIELLPSRYNHGRIVVGTREVAIEARSIILGE